MSYRGESSRCIQCDAGLAPVGARFVCEQCKSTLISAAELAALLDELSPDDSRPLDRRMFPAKGQGDTCPRCATRMARVFIHDTGMQRCPEHGVWFAKSALADLLLQHSQLHAERTREQTKAIWFSLVPAIGALAGPLNEALLPWAKRRRLRKYLARTTPRVTK